VIDKPEVDDGSREELAASRSRRPRQYIDCPLESIGRRIPWNTWYWGTESGHIVCARDPAIICMSDPRPFYLRAAINPGGYPFVYLRDKLGNRRATPIHLVNAELYLGERLPGLQVRHMDGNRLNNAVSNLAYGTNRDNYIDSIRHGTCRGFDKTLCRSCVKHRSSCPIDPVRLVYQCVEYVAQESKR
jgi:hypothetical protein